MTTALFELTALLFVSAQFTLTFSDQKFHKCRAPKNFP